MTAHEKVTIELTAAQLDRLISMVKGELISARYQAQMRAVQRRDGGGREVNALLHLLDTLQGKPRP